MNKFIPKELEIPLIEFRQDLDKNDLAVLDDLLLKAQDLNLAICHSGHDLPYQVALLALLIEEHKDVGRLRQLVEQLIEHQRVGLLDE